MRLRMRGANPQLHSVAVYGYRDCVGGLVMPRNPSNPGRPRGEKHVNAKLTEHDVRLIRELNKGEHKLGYKRIAKKFELAYSTVRAICTYSSWIHVP